MPYIKNGDRPNIDAAVLELAEHIDNEGDLNYAITKLLLRYLSEKGRRYATLNTIMGILSCVANEFYRRVVAPYEDKKIQENGDIDGFSN